MQAPAPPLPPTKNSLPSAQPATRRLERARESGRLAARRGVGGEALAPARGVAAEAAAEGAGAWAARVEWGAPLR
jgi:hypothetical protein